MPERACLSGEVPVTLWGDSDLPMGTPGDFWSIIGWIKWEGGDCRIMGLTWARRGWGWIGRTNGFISGGGPWRPPWPDRGTPPWVCIGGGCRWACDPEGFNKGGGWPAIPWAGKEGEALSGWLGDEFPLLPAGDPDICSTCNSSSFLSLLVIPCSASYSSRTCCRLKRRL